MENKQINKKFKIIILLIIGIIIVSISAVFAIRYLNEITVVNNFNALLYDVTLEEEFYDDWGTKNVYINNKEESAPVVIRVNYNEFWSKESSGDIILTLNNKINDINVVEKDWTVGGKEVEFNTDFTKGEDGWYYYNKILKAGETVHILNSINLNEDLLKETSNYELYNSYDYELTINYEAIQATNKAIKDIWGYEIVVNDDTITWNF